MDLFRRQELENPHGPLATRTAPDRRFNCLRHVCWRRSRQQSSAQGEEHTASPIRQEAEVPNARKASREDMFQKTPEELFVRQRHRSTLAAVGVVFPEERHVGVREIDEPVMGDRHAMCVPGQVMQNVVGTTEGPLGIHHPVFAK